MLFQLKRNDDNQTLVYTCQNEDGSVVDLTGATVTFIMGKKNKIITESAARISAAVNGVVEYDFNETDTLFQGNYIGEFVVSFPNGRQQTFPTNGYIAINIEQNIDTNQTNIVLDAVAAKQGQFEKKLKDILKLNDISISFMNEYSWVTNAGQTEFILPEPLTLSLESKWFEMVIGGIVIDPSLVDRSIPNKIILLVDSQKIPAGEEVIARWTESVAPITPVEGGIQLYNQDVEPEGVKEGTLWLDTSENVFTGTPIDGIDEKLQRVDELDVSVSTLSSQLAEKANKSDLDIVNTNVSLKADKTYVESNLSTLDSKINSQASGAPKGTYATLSALQTAFPTGTTGIYLVTADGKWYYWSGSAWTAGGIYQATGMNLELKPTTVNLFDKTKLRTGYEVYSTGAIQAQGVDSAVTDYINVSGATSVFVSGLTAYTAGIARNVFFYDTNKAPIAGTLAQIAMNLTEKQINVPANAVYLVMSPWQRKTSAEVVNLDTIQIEISTVKTAYQPYKQGISKIENYDIIKTTSPKTAGKNFLLFGDSITETATVSDDGATYTEGTRSNWPTFSKKTLQMGQMWNYAKSGGHFLDGYQVGQIRQQLYTQITTAIANNRPADIIVVAIGTNDDSGGLVLGDYNTAMGKATLNDLDRTKFAEAVRWAFWQLRTSYPNATCFYATPLQRGDKELNQTMIDLAVKIAKRYNFIIIDAQNESGIVREFENGAVRYLSDGLHPNTAGQQLQSKLFNRVILNALNDGN